MRQLVLVASVLPWLFVQATDNSADQTAAPAHPAPCPHTLDTQSLSSASYECADELLGKRSLADTKVFLDATFKAASDMTSSPASRRLALNALGNLCWAGNKYCNPKKRKWLQPLDSLLKARAGEFGALLRKYIVKEFSDSNLDAALTLTRKGNWAKAMSGAEELKGRLNQLASDGRLDAGTRFDANEVWSDLLADPKHTLDQRDVQYLMRCLNSWDMYIRRSCALTTKTIFHRLSLLHQTALKSRLELVLGQETDLLTKVNVATALDSASGNHIAVHAIQAGLESRSLPNSFKLKTGHVLVRSSADQTLSRCYAASAERERDAYFHLFEIAPNPQDIMNLFVFPTPKEYGEYMKYIVQYGATAGGLYVHSANHTLYTFQRSDRRYYISLNELVLHESTHFLNRRYIFGEKKPKLIGWLDEGLAEYMGGLNFNLEGCYSAPARQNYMLRICKADYKKTWKLQALLTSDQGYGVAGTFHYHQAYTFLHFLVSKHLPALKRFLKVVQRGKYQLSALYQTTGLSVSQLESQWHAHIEKLCAHSLPHYEARSFKGIEAETALIERDLSQRCPAPKAEYNSEEYKHCAVIGHGGLAMDIIQKQDLGQPHEGAGAEVLHELGISY